MVGVVHSGDLNISVAKEPTRSMDPALCADHTTGLFSEGVDRLLYIQTVATQPSQCSLEDGIAALLSAPVMNSSRAALPLEHKVARGPCTITAENRA